MARGDFAGREAVDLARKALTEIEMELMSHGPDTVPDVAHLRLQLTQLKGAHASLELAVASAVAFGTD